MIKTLQRFKSKSFFKFKTQHNAKENKINLTNDKLFFKLNHLYSENKYEEIIITKKIKNKIPKGSKKKFNLDNEKLYLIKVNIKTKIINSDINLLNINETGNSKIK